MDKLPTVDDLMDKAFTKFKPNTPMGEAIETLIKEQLIGACVVDDAGRLVGILSERDSLKVILQDAYHRTPSRPVAEYMHEPARTISRHLGVVDVAQIFIDQPYRRLPVVEDGKLVGQITRRDVLKWLRSFEPGA